MQQDDQNTFKNLPKPMNNQHHTQTRSIRQTQIPTLIEKRNILNEGINYIVPSFWYQQLIELNREVKSLQNIKFPSLQTYVSFLALCGLENPSQSAFSNNKLFPKDSALLGSNLLDQCHYLSSKTLQFSKINNFINNNQIEWSVINPLLWNLIEIKFQLSQQKPQNSPALIQNHLQNKSKSLNVCYNQSIPKIAVFFTKLFIIQQGITKVKQQKNNPNEEFVSFLHKNVKYMISRSFLNHQISNQLKKITQKQISITLLVDQSIKRSNFFRKTHVSGYFSQNLPFKELLKSLVEIESLRKYQSPQKFYIFDQYGQKIAQKITTVSTFLKISQNKRLIISTTHLDQIINSHTLIKKNLMSMLKSDFNFPQYDTQETRNSQKIKESINKITIFFDRLSKQNKVRILLKQLKNNHLEIENNQSIPISSGFKPYNNESNDIRILSGTFYRQEQEINQNNRQSEQARYLDSVTTNFDTPQVDLENQSQRVPSQSNYSNVRLKKHSSYNRTQRKKKSQIYMQRKKRNNYIVRNNSNNNAQSGNNGFDSGEYKKRIKYMLFQSLCSLQEDPQTLGYLIENMRKVAIQSIYSHEDDLIKHPFTKKIQNKGSQDFKQSFQTTDTKLNFWNCNPKSQQANESSREIQIKGLEESLLQISSQIESRYQPQIQFEKGIEEKYYEKNMIEKLYQDYEQLMAMKKDNQEIRTIIDNSEGPYSEVEKHSIKIKYRGTQKTISKVPNQYHQIDQMSDGLQQIEDNSQTI